MRYTPKSTIWGMNRHFPIDSQGIARKNIAALRGDKGDNPEPKRTEDNPLTIALRGLIIGNRVSEPIRTRVDFLLQHSWDALKGDSSSESRALIKFINESIAVKMIPDRAINHYLEPLEQIIDNPE